MDKRELAEALNANLYIVYASHWPDGAILTGDALARYSRLCEPPEHIEELNGLVAQIVAKHRQMPVVGTLDLDRYLGLPRHF